MTSTSYDFGSVYVADFETTTYTGQTYTEVWCSGLCKLGTEAVIINHSIEEFFQSVRNIKANATIYFHNLKFDGNFILYYLEKTKKYKQAGFFDNNGDWVWFPVKSFQSGNYRYLISDRGQWYSITVKMGKYLITFKDSVKLFPFKLKEVGKAFATKHQKKTMEYEGFRYAGCPITDQEVEYIKNDVLVLKEALEFFLAQGHSKSTIGSCCFTEFKNMLKTKSTYDFNELFPVLKDVSCPIDGFDDCDAYIRKAYRGGWVYLKKGCENKVYTNGLTADVNSLYPSQMHSKSRSRYPVGLPMFWTGDIPDKVKCNSEYFYYVRIKTRFYLNDGYLPFIQIKNSYLYKSTEVLETSDVYDKKYHCYRSEYKVGEELHDTRVELTLSCVDFKLFLQHYDVKDFEILDGCYFYTMIGIFDDYIDKYMSIKANSKGAMRTLAKLFLNNLYGKFSTSDDSSYKLCYMNEDNILCYTSVQENEKKTYNIAVGAAVTSYARNFTISHAQLNYDSFIYADTDSLHCNCSISDLKDIEISDTELLKWKIEKQWDTAIFVRSKTYIEIDNEITITCAGMPEHCKNLLKSSMTGTQDINGYIEDGVKKEYTDDEKAFLFTDNEKIKRSIKDFKIGLKVPGKLIPKRIIGGIVLQSTTFEIR